MSRGTLERVRTSYWDKMTRMQRRPARAARNHATAREIANSKLAKCAPWEPIVSTETALTVSAAIRPAWANAWRVTSPVLSGLAPTFLWASTTISQWARVPERTNHATATAFASLKTARRVPWAAMPIASAPSAPMASAATTLAAAFAKRAQPQRKAPARMACAASILQARIPTMNALPLATARECANPSLSLQSHPANLTQATSA